MTEYRSVFLNFKRKAAIDRRKKKKIATQSPLMSLTRSIWLRNIFRYEEMHGKQTDPDAAPRPSALINSIAPLAS